MLRPRPVQRMASSEGGGSRREEATEACVTGKVGAYQAWDNQVGLQGPKCQRYLLIN